MYSNKGLAKDGILAYLVIFKRESWINGPSGSVSIEAVPSLIKILRKAQIIINFLLYSWKVNSNKIFYVAQKIDLKSIQEL